METVSGVSNWKLMIRREEAGVVLLRAETCDRKASLPDELFGLPVTILGDHALTPGRKAPEGEEVLITCGPTPEEWNNANLEDLQLPQNLRRVEDYAFFNCGKLKTLRLTDQAQHWGGGALMNCRKLDTFHLTCSGQEGELLAYFADELSRELSVTLYREDGEIARLIFPEYLEVYEENCAAHHFDYNIYGAGYPYHHCFRQKKLSFKEYDALWRPMLGMEHDDDCAMRLAWWRLRYPVELMERAEEDYLTYLQSRAGMAIRWLLEEGTQSDLQFLLSRTSPDKETLAEGCALAREKNAPEALAVLLEEQHKRFPTGMNKTFDL